jgi:hypothetical protein
MLSRRVEGAVPSGASRESGEVVAFYICGGVRPTPAGFTLFPHGGSIESNEICPAREICAWHASHDFGGEFAINEQPEARLLPVEFKTGAFACPHFHDHQALLKANKAGRCKCACGRRRAAAFAPAAQAAR